MQIKTWSQSIKKYRIKLNILFTQKIITQRIHSKNNNSEDYDETHVKIRFKLNDGLPLKKTLETHDVLIVDIDVETVCMF